MGGAFSLLYVSELFGRLRAGVPTAFESESNTPFKDFLTSSDKMHNSSSTKVVS